MRELIVRACRHRAGGGHGPDGRRRQSVSARLIRRRSNRRLAAHATAAYRARLRARFDIPHHAGHHDRHGDPRSRRCRRGAGKARALAAAGADIVTADANDEASLPRALQGAHGACRLTRFRTFATALRGARDVASAPAFDPVLRTFDAGLRS
jgi:uncharacterized protein YbjT (DUF2867 family)